MYKNTRPGENNPIRNGRCRSDENDEEAIYEMVEDDSELDYIGRIFSELLEDIDIER